MTTVIKVIDISTVGSLSDLYRPSREFDILKVDSNYCNPSWKEADHTLDITHPELVSVNHNL